MLELPLVAEVALVTRLVVLVGIESTFKHQVQVMVGGSSSVLTEST
jgi:hypothetical protein